MRTASCRGFWCVPVCAVAEADKGLVRRFLVKVTGFSRAQASRLISQYWVTGRIEDRLQGPKRPFRRRYTKADIGLLAEVGKTLGGLCVAVTRRMMQRQYEVFGDARFERLAGFSNSHLYRRRRSVTYRRRWLQVAKTRPTQVNVGEHPKPHLAGRPGFLRVDSVHQGDLDREKGLYEINLVDEVTQYEFVAGAEGISERFLVPALQGSIEALPSSSRVSTPTTAPSTSTTKSPRCCASCTLRSSPNPPRGSATTTPWSRARTPRWSGATSATTTFPAITPPSSTASCRDMLAPFLNYHRPCHFPVGKTGTKGRVRKTYPFDNVITPNLKLKSLDGAAFSLRPGVTFEQLDQEAWHSTTSPRRPPSTKRWLRSSPRSDAATPPSHE